MSSVLEIPVGRKFGRLTFIKRVQVGGALKCLCRCECGTEKVVYRGKLTTGATKSCGCLRHRTGSEASAFKHGHATGGARSPTLSVWSNMIDRCSRPAHTEWRNYGGRGVSVCARWKNFSLFLADMGERPSAQHTLDRVDNDRGYSPENCRWATRKEQMRNTRQNDLLIVDGSALCQVDAAVAVGVSRDRLKRLNRRGFKLSTDDRHFLQTVHTNGRLLTFRGRTQSVTHWALELGISRNAIYKRLSRGWSVEAALSQD